MAARRVIKPQAGFQRQFLSCSADIAIGGGAAGAGKSWSQIMAVAPYLRVPYFTFAYFRRTRPELTGPDSIWEESKSIFPLFGGRKREGNYLDWRFPVPGVYGVFSHLQHVDDIEAHKSKAYCFVGLDELTTFEPAQFWGLWSRCRSRSGVRPFLRATTNPDPDSFVRELIDWWIGPEGYPIPERSGVIRYFVRIGDEIKWSSDRIALEHSTRRKSTSFTYVPGKLSDNKELLKIDPQYETKLENLPRVEREKLLLGNWNIKMVAGDYFQRNWFPVWPGDDDGLRILLAGTAHRVRAWDLAGTPVKGNQLPDSDEVQEVARSKDPDWTRGIKVSRLVPGNAVDYVVEHMVSARDRPGAIEALIERTAEHDGHDTTVAIFQDPGQAGKAQAERLQARLEAKGYHCTIHRAERSKEVYAELPSGIAERRRMGYIHGPWILPFFNEAEAFPGGGHDDCVDALSLAIMELGDAGEAPIELTFSPELADMHDGDSLFGSGLGRGDDLF